jgi:hypothetical protein
MALVHQDEPEGSRKRGGSMARKHEKTEFDTKKSKKKVRVEFSADDENDVIDVASVEAFDKASDQPQQIIKVPQSDRKTLVIAFPEEQGPTPKAAGGPGSDWNTSAFASAPEGTRQAMVTAQALPCPRYILKKVGGAWVCESVPCPP